MKRSFAALPLLLLLVLAAPVRAEAPTTDALAFGIELCPQSICGSAIFVGILNGEVAGVTTSSGSFLVSVKHDDLPTQLNPISFITGGAFELRAGLRTIRGTIVGGTLIYQPDNTFLVSMSLVARNGSTMTFEGVLSHQTFPPTITGHIFSN
jgi:hypothetical protein